MRLFKIELQSLPHETGLTGTVITRRDVEVEIEYRLFCHITENWRERPYQPLAVVDDRLHYDQDLLYGCELEDGGLTQKGSK